MELHSVLRSVQWIGFLAGAAAGSISTAFVCAIEYPSINYSRALFIGIVFGTAVAFLFATILMLVEYRDAKKSGKLGTWAIVYEDDVATEV